MTMCSFCWEPATTQVEDDNDIFPACDEHAEAWRKNPGFTQPDDLRASQGETR